MTFEMGKKYRDAVGRMWRVKKILMNELDGSTRLMNVVRYFIGGPSVYTYAVDNRDGTATVLLDDGFTTIYEDEEVKE